MIHNVRGFFSKKQKKASRLLMKIRRGFDLSTGSGGLNFDMPSGGGLLSGLLSFLFTRKVGRQRV